MVRSPVLEEDILSPENSKPNLGPTQTPTQWVSGLFLSAKRCGVKLTTHPHVVPSFRMSGATPLLPTRLHALDRAKFSFTCR